MRLYTIETNGMAKVAVGMDDALHRKIIYRTMILWINWIMKLSLV